MGVETVTEAITVTSESPLIEVSRSTAASNVGELEIDALPIIGRDFTDFAYLTPTVAADTSQNELPVVIRHSGRDAVQR